MAQLVLPGMREHGGGWIVNISSRSAGPKVGPPYPVHPLGGIALYGGTKAMVDRVTSGAAMELHEDNIAVNSLAPALTVFTDNARRIGGDDMAAMGWDLSTMEPVEVMAEATLALSCCDPSVLTGRITYSVTLIRELRRPVRTLDGRDLVAGWQPEDVDRIPAFAGYLATSS
jgi:NAD(P)-dependent dehydrogenase (short-subunit alcohol dehydrogenase family)